MARVIRPYRRKNYVRAYLKCFRNVLILIFIPCIKVSFRHFVKGNACLQDLGYITHLVGKWDLGYSRWNETPTSRGFNSFLGYLTNYVSYYDYLNTLTVSENNEIYSRLFYDAIFPFARLHVRYRNVRCGFCFVFHRI